MNWRSTLLVFVSGVFFGALACLLVAPPRRTLGQDAPPKSSAPTDPPAAVSPTHPSANRADRAAPQPNEAEAASEASPHAGTSSTPGESDSSDRSGAEVPLGPTPTAPAAPSAAKGRPPHELSPHERIDLLTSARPSLPNATATQAAGYRMWYGPVIEPGHRANAPTEVGIRVMALAVRSGFADDEQAKNSLVDSAFEMELKRLELVRRVFEEREKAVADLRARGAGMRDYVAYHIDNDAIYVIQPGQFPDLDAAVEELTRCERKDRASLEEQARRYAR